eukprot:6422461-Prymnesium_polylepis.1
MTRSFLQGPVGAPKGPLSSTDEYCLCGVWSVEVWTGLWLIRDVIDTSVVETRERSALAPLLAAVPVARLDTE